MFYSYRARRPIWFGGSSWGLKPLETLTTLDPEGLEFRLYEGYQTLVFRPPEGLVEPPLVVLRTSSVDDLNAGHANAREGRPSFNLGGTEVAGMNTLGAESGLDAVEVSHQFAS